MIFTYITCDREPKGRRHCISSLVTSQRPRMPTFVTVFESSLQVSVCCINVLQSPNGKSPGQLLRGRNAAIVTFSELSSSRVLYKKIREKEKTTKTAQSPEIRKILMMRRGLGCMFGVRPNIYDGMVHGRGDSFSPSLTPLGSINVV